MTMEQGIRQLSLMEYHRMKKKNCMRLPEIGEIALVVGEEKNCGHWMKGKVEKLIKEKWKSL